MRFTQTRSPFRATKPIGADLRFLSSQSDSRETLRDHGYAASASRAVCLSTLVAPTHCTYPGRDGQAELTWVAGYIQRRYTRERSPISVLAWLSVE